MSEGLAGWREIRVREMDLKDYRILVVNPNLDEIERISRYLNRSGAVVTSTVDGLMAVRHVNQYSYGAILLDMKVKNIDVNNIFNAIKASDRNRSAVRFLTMDPEDDEAKKISNQNKANRLIRPIDDTVVRFIANKMKKDAIFYDPRIIKAFISSICEVLIFYLGKVPKVGKPTTKKNESQIVAPVSACVEFDGLEVHGYVRLDLEEEMIGNFVSDILGLEGDDVLDIEVRRDFTGELCNQILGKARPKFSSIGLKIEMGLPKIIISDDADDGEKKGREFGAHFGFPVATDIGSCLAEIGMVSKKSDSEEEEFCGEASSWLK